MVRVESGPRVHVTAPSGWLNDPVGGLVHGGRQHLFFQHVPWSTRWEVACAWGHLVGEDLVRWRHLPVALAPGEGEDGVWSGCAVLDESGADVDLHQRAGRSPGPGPDRAGPAAGRRAGGLGQTRRRSGAGTAARPEPDPFPGPVRVEEARRLADRTKDGASMRILITGGTGHLGRDIVGRRVDPGDLATGRGITEAVSGTEVIVHAGTFRRPRDAA